MAGITDAAMRSICISLGAPLAFTEMVSARGLVEGNRNTKTLLSHFPNEKQLIVQIFGRDPEIMAEACRMLNDQMRDVLFGIDLNMGCPAPKIFRHGEGAALMGEPLLAARIIEACVRASQVPISVKMRTGLNDQSLNATEFALMAERSGAARIAVHGRTAAMLYRGLADREMMAAVKQSVRIPVIANGDIHNAGDALALRTDTGADGVMIARGAIGNPFLFREIRALFDGKAIPEPATVPERIETLLTQTLLAIEDKGEYVAIREMRAQIPKYLKGMHGAAAMRAACNATDTYDALAAMLRSNMQYLEPRT